MHSEDSTVDEQLGSGTDPTGREENQNRGLRRHILTAAPVEKNLLGPQRAAIPKGKEMRQEARAHGEWGVPLGPTREQNDHKQGSRVLWGGGKPQRRAQGRRLCAS
ncbi:hypothetical protein TRVL_08297 [Trypanosoma vivax]|nr:hypothetical protein TRVL_08297 [Trypanosoma vivax]